MSTAAKTKSGGKAKRLAPRRVSVLVEKFAAEFGPQAGAKAPKVDAVDLLIKLRRGA